MAPLQVVCLISGGKDSLFSILHCLQNGHDVVALANLHPPLAAGQDADEDLDSYMYQTVGHKVIPLYEKALGLPLYRQEIAGSAVNQSKSYGRAAESAEQEDETESLVPLLQKVKEHHPGLSAVSTGAILSDYQRTRVESVAVRLGLTPLSYLWEWPNIPPHTQTTLLEDMSAAGQDSRIIKVASGGLDSSFLWSNVADPRTMNRIQKAVMRFGSADDGAVLGEGGEYETLAVAGPTPLWKGMIEVGNDQMQVVAGEAGTASLVIDAAKVIHHDTGHGFTGARTPPLLEPQFEELLHQISVNDTALPADHHERSSSPAQPSQHVCYQYMTGPAGKPVADQMAAIMKRDALSTVFDYQNPRLETSGISYVSIILRNMADFSAINAVYTKSFTEPNPPARVTLAEPSVLSKGKDVMVALTCVAGPTTARQGLHVQSQSYWAPANIGPYSQAISVPVAGEGVQRFVYIAGQIPLIPASMELASPEAADGDVDAFTRQTILAAQHFLRIGRAMQVRRWACGIAFITAVSDEDAAKKAGTARRAWEGLHRSLVEFGTEVDDDADADAEDFDIWHLKHGAQRSQRYGQSTARIGADSAQRENVRIPRLAVIQVTALPRGASIEWATYGLTATEASQPSIPHFEHLLEVFKARVVR